LIPEGEVVGKKISPISSLCKELLPTKCTTKLAGEKNALQLTSNTAVEGLLSN
jgi:hypothetical protein